MQLEYVKDDSLRRRRVRVLTDMGIGPLSEKETV